MYSAIDIFIKFVILVAVDLLDVKHKGYVTNLHIYSYATYLENLESWYL